MRRGNRVRNDETPQPDPVRRVGPPDASQQGGRTSRRRFVDWLLGTSAGALLIAALYPILRYTVPPRAAEAATTGVLLPFGPAEVPANSGRIFRFGTQPGIILRTPGGDLRAFSAVCTHLGCIVQYRPDLAHIWCACHNGHFDLHGTNVAGPPPRPLEEWTVNVTRDQIRVSRGATTRSA